MQELRQDEIDEVNGGAILLIFAVAAVAGSVGLGIYIGYREARAAAMK